MAEADAGKPRYPSTLGALVKDPGVARRVFDVLQPITDEILAPANGVKRVLELSSGIGEHVVLYSAKHPGITWQPTEADSYMAGLIQARLEDEGNAASNVKSPLAVDFNLVDHWKSLEVLANEEGTYDVTLITNVFHMIPFPRTAQTVFSHLRPLSSPGAKIVLYGPFKADSGFLSEGDAKFDVMIKTRPDGAYLGLRSWEETARIAQAEGWELVKRHDMPSGNHCLVFKLKE